MSTYYSFGCDNCKQLGGFYSRQAWGVGNADLIDTFKFTMYHALNCGTDNIRMFSEHEYPLDDDWVDVNVGSNLEARKKFLEDTADYMPSSNDWQFVQENKDKDWGEIKKLWVEKEREALEDDKPQQASSGGKYDFTAALEQLEQSGLKFSLTISNEGRTK